MKKKAFTLVELLVVVSIIALLIAMLAPSLKAARDVVRTTYCRSTINALNKSVFVYSENNRGFMMVYSHKVDPAGGHPRAGANTYQSYVCFKSGTIDPNTGVFSDARGFGLVYAMKLLYPAEMFYCPDPDPVDQRMNIEGYPKPWGTHAGSGSDFIRNSYMWNPWVMHNPLSMGNYTFEDFLMLGRHPNSRFLTSDLLDDYVSMRHKTSVSASWNMGYADGHVFTFTSGRVSGKVTFYSMMLDQKIDQSGNWGPDAGPGNTTGYNGVIRPMLPQ
jgi:prepilin-type N-terminal cleavage/methylation domain-containing protein